MDRRILAGLLMVTPLLLCGCDSADVAGDDGPFVMGRVVDTEGLVVAGAQVTVAPGQGVAASDPQGFFVVGAMTGANDVTVRRDGYLPRSLQVVVPEDATSSPEYLVKSLQMTTVTLERDEYAGVTAEVRVANLCPAGQPVALECRIVNGTTGPVEVRSYKFTVRDMAGAVVTAMDRSYTGRPTMLPGNEYVLGEIWDGAVGHTTAEYVPLVAECTLKLQLGGTCVATSARFAMDLRERSQR